MDAARIITAARERAGLSKRELARLAGTSASAIVKYESGQMSPSVDTLDRIVRLGGWRVELGLVPLAPGTAAAEDAAERGRMIADLLGIVDMVDIRPASPRVEFPRFVDAIR